VNKHSYYTRHQVCLLKTITDNEARCFIYLDFSDCNKFGSSDPQTTDMHYNMLMLTCARARANMSTLHLFIFRDSSLNRGEHTLLLQSTSGVAENNILFL
jgi:hypothetical protein